MARYNQGRHPKFIHPFIRLNDEAGNLVGGKYYTDSPPDASDVSETTSMTCSDTVETDDTNVPEEECMDENDIPVQLDNVDDRKASSESMNEHAGVCTKGFHTKLAQTVHFVLPDCIEETTKLDRLRHQLKQK